jgi:tetratricopeptide (TPR) repeat protein
LDLTKLKGLKYKSILFLLFLALGKNLNAQVQTNSRLAFEYYNDAEWEKAAPLFLEIYRSNNAKIYLDYYVRCLSELGDFDGAEKELRKAQRSTRNVSLYVDLANIYELQKDKKKAEEYLEKPFSEFPNNINEIRNLGNQYLIFRRFDHAQRTYEIGRMILGQPNEFHVELANLYRMQRMHDKMVDEYLALLLTQPQFLPSVENYLLAALATDIDGDLLDITRKKTIEQIQIFPGFPTFTELLIWVYVQENEFDLAVDQAISLDIRGRNSGQQTLLLARQARQAGDFASSLRAYNYIISQNPSRGPTGNPIPVNPQAPRIQALLESKNTRLEQLEQSKDPTRKEFQDLVEEYRKILPEFDNPEEKAKAFKDLAYISMFYLLDYPVGLSQIDSAINLSARNRDQYMACELDKADYLLISGDPWNATLAYARIDKENKENPVGSIAKLRKAQLAFFTGDFNWALSQLNVLKGSSSKLIANDAFELAGLIKNNQSPEDSLNTGLLALSHAHNYLFQRKTDSCLMVLDTLITSDRETLAKDDALFMKAEIILKSDPDQAMVILNTIISDYKFEMWGHKALFKLGEIHFNRGQNDKALELLTELINTFPNSFYNLDARDFIRKIRELQNSQNSE